MNRLTGVSLAAAFTLVLGPSLGGCGCFGGCKGSNPSRDESAVKGSSLYARLGGLNGVAAVCDDFVDRLAADKKIMSNPHVAEHAKTLSIPALKFKLTAQVACLTGGPWNYAGRDMKSIHADMAITEAEWNASVDDLRASLNKFKVPMKEQNELIAIIASTHDDVVTRK